MTSWPGGIAAITLFVSDVEATRGFYEHVFAMAPIFTDGSSAAFRFGSTVVNLLAASAAPELVAPLPVGEPLGGPQAVLTLSVDDVDATCARLADLGVSLVNGPMDRPWGPRTASFRDPGGHVWEIASG